MSDYRIRPAIITDHPFICRHRRQMFSDMGLEGDQAGLDREFGRWLSQAMATGLYRGWIVETAQNEVIAGSGLTVLPWPPSLRDLNDRVAFVYNVYTEPSHRRRGLARRLMNTMHEWCRTQGIRTVRLHASAAGRALYESLDYKATNEMMLML